MSGSRAGLPSFLFTLVFFFFSVKKSRKQEASQRLHFTISCVGFRNGMHFLPWLLNLFEGFRPLVRIPHVCFAFNSTALFGGYHFRPSWTLTARFHKVFHFLMVSLWQYSLIHFPLSHPNVCLSLCGGSHGISCDKIYF